MNRFVSAFELKIEAMLSFRVARGYKEETHLPSLKNFDAFCSVNYPGQNTLTQDIVYDWLKLDTAKVTSGLTEKAKAIRQLGLYLVATDEEAYVLSEKLSVGRKKFTPYIFTDNELTALFSAIDNLPENKNIPYLHVIAPVLFRLMYTCGLRPTEGREVLYENVNFKTGEVKIVKTKKKKDRIVVVSDDMLALLNRYRSQHRIFAGDSPYLFPAANGKPFASARISGALSKAWIDATCTPERPIAKRIRAYDLRHRFASERLNLWLDEGRNLVAMLPYLREYMGHDSLSETAYYIHILPERLIKSPGVDWQKLNDMFPVPTLMHKIDEAGMAK